MEASQADPAIRTYLYTCKECRKQFRVVIDTSVHSIHQAQCPSCRKLAFFDNRNGSLERRLTRKGRTAPTAPAKAGPGTSPSSLQDRAKVPLPPGSPNGMPPGPRKASASQDHNTDANRSFPSFRRLPEFGAWQGIRERLSWVGRSLQSGGNAAYKRFGLLQLAFFAGGGGLVLLGLLFFSLRFPSLYLGSSPEHYIQGLSGSPSNLILDSRGRLIGELFRKKTGNIKPDRLPEKMAHTLLFVEDTDFYSHTGIRFGAIFRAFVKNLTSWGYSQGGSTITQQLARILLADRSKNILRKLRETSLAYYLESQLSKDEILAAYMSRVYLGHGSLGFDNAARFYFGKELSELGFSERLALACLPSAPERYSPLRNPGLLAAKMDAVFERMQDEGFPAPTKAVFEKETHRLFSSLNQSPTASIFGSRINDAPYVSEHIRLFIRRKLGKEYEYSAGLRIETTIDRDLQRWAVKEIHAHIRERGSDFPPVIMKDDKVLRRFGSKPEERLRRDYEAASLGAFLMGLSLPHLERPRLQAAAVGIKSRTGEIVFLQGGADFGSNNQLNRAVKMRRQTGSSIKPIVYSAAIESGAVHVATLLEDRPIFVAGGSSKKGYWLPGNYSGIYEGEISVRKALAKSQNIPAIQVLRKAGLPRVAQQFQKFFFPKDEVFRRRFRMDETVAIGSLEMSPLEMATAYTAFGNNGVIQRPYLIKKITAPDGTVLYQHKGHDEFHLQIPEERQVIRPDAAEIMVSLMKDSARYGGVRRGGFHRTLIGKTGTSNQYRDVWFVGATPAITTAVWLGYDHPSYSMYHGTGAGLAGPLWGRIMRHSPRPRKGFSFQPRAVRAKVCAETGRRPTASCRKVIQELFLKEYLPEAPTEKELQQGKARRVLTEVPEDESDFD